MKNGLLIEKLLEIKAYVNSVNGLSIALIRADKLINQLIEQLSKTKVKETKNE